MKQVGHGDAQMFFYVDSASVLAGKSAVGSGCWLRSLITAISPEPD